MLPVGEMCAYRKVFHCPSMVKDALTKGLPGRGSQRRDKHENRETKQNKTKKNETSTTTTKQKAELLKDLKPTRLTALSNLEQKYHDVSVLVLYFVY